MFDQFQQNTQAVGDSLFLSAMCALIPLAVLFILLGGLKVRAWISGLIALAAAIVVAVVLFGMPAGQALSAAVNGALFGFFPILWIVINAVWIYNLTVASGHFEVLRLSFEKVSPDQRIQAIIIAFCFGALLEALAGFGTPVAISVVMLMSLGFKPIKAATVALVANTAPVAFGALAIPIVTLAPIAAGVSNDPRLSDANALDTLGSMVGRQTPILALFVPLILVLIVDGRRGVRQTWLPAMVAGTVFGLAQFVTSNYLSVQLTDIVASLLSAGSVVLLLRVWQPAEVLTAERVSEEERVHAGASSESARVGAGSGATTTRGAGTGEGPGAGAAAGGGARQLSVDNRGDVMRAYAPYLVIIVIFSLTNIPAVVDYLAKAPWTYLFDWPGLDILNDAGDPVATQFKFNWLPAAGTLLIIAGLITMVILKVSPARALKTYVATLVELQLGDHHRDGGAGPGLRDEPVGPDDVAGRLAGRVRWGLRADLAHPRVDRRGCHRVRHVVELAVRRPAGAGGDQGALDPVLMAAANSSGGVLGKMVSPQNLAIAAAAVGLSGNEGVIFRKVIGWSLLLLVLMCAIVGLQATPVLSWMVP